MNYNAIPAIEPVAAGDVPNRPGPPALTEPPSKARANQFLGSEMTIPQQITYMQTALRFAKPHSRRRHELIVRLKMLVLQQMRREIKTQRKIS